MDPIELGFPAGSSDETELFLQWLDYLRRAVLRNVDGLTDDQARWTPDGKLVPLIGVLSHLTNLEHRWIDGGFAGADVWQDEAEFHPGPDLSLAAAVEAYRTRAAVTDALVRSRRLSDLGGGWARGHDLRFVLLHVIEETARHAGHMDATRELLDGRTGM